MSNKSNTGFATVAVAGAADTFKTRIVQGKAGVQAVCRALDATSASASSFVLAFAARHALKTTVAAATADAATAITLNADDDGYINGYQIADGDYLLVNTNAGSADDVAGHLHSWRLLTIGTATEDAANDEVDLASCVGHDGHTGIEGTVSAGATAYVLRADHAITLAVGAASISKTNVIAGDLGEPIAFLMDPAAATAHDYSAFVEYI